MQSSKAADVGENVFIQEHKLTNAPVTKVTETSIKTEVHQEGRSGTGVEVGQYTNSEKTGTVP